MTVSWLTSDVILLLCQGCLITIALTLTTSVLSLVLGVLVGMARLHPGRFYAWSSAIYVELWRNVPALVLIIFFAFALPNLFSSDIRRVLFFDNDLMQWLESWTWLSIPYYLLAAIVGLSLNTSAYLAELFRAGVGTIAQEQVETAKTLGAARHTIFTHILLPQGFSAAFPAISTRLIHNMKNTALAAFVSVPEFFHSIETAMTRSFRALEFLLLAAVVYLSLSFLFTRLLRRCEVYLDNYTGLRRSEQPQTYRFQRVEETG